MLRKDALRGWNAQSLGLGEWAPNCHILWRWTNNIDGHKTHSTATMASDSLGIFHFLEGKTFRASCMII